MVVEGKLKGISLFTTRKKARKRLIRKAFFFMPVVGLEPTRHCWQRILSPHRLPFRHTGEQQQMQYSKKCVKMQA